MIWFWLLFQKYVARVVVTKVMRIRCEFCSQRYEYELEREGIVEVSELFSVSESQKDDADDEAEELANDLLDGAIDCVPCPGCSFYQPEMVEELILERLAQLRRLARLPLLGGLVATIGCAGFAIPLFTGSFTTASGNFWLVVIGLILLSSFAVFGFSCWVLIRTVGRRSVMAADPNAASGRRQRLRLAKTRAMLLED